MNSNIFFTSDWHIGHENIIRYCRRPFSSVEEMNQTLIANYNARVSKNDICYFIGDICLGNRAETLKEIKKLNGKKILITGNHDNVFRIAERTKAQKAAKLYFDNGFCEIYDQLIIYPQNFDRAIRLYHFPYTNAEQQDSIAAETRFHTYRLNDDGILLLHGHTHQPEKITGKNSIHIGVDAWQFYPVSLSEIAKLELSLNCY